MVSMRSKASEWLDWVGEKDLAGYFYTDIKHFCCQKRRASETGEHQKSENCAED